MRVVYLLFGGTESWTTLAPIPAAIVTWVKRLFDCSRIGFLAWRSKSIGGIIVLVQDRRPGCGVRPASRWSLRLDAGSEKLSVRSADDRALGHLPCWCCIRSYIAHTAVLSGVLAGIVVGAWGGLVDRFLFWKQEISIKTESTVSGPTPFSLFSSAAKKTSGDGRQASLATLGGYPCRLQAVVKQGRGGGSTHPGQPRGSRFSKLESGISNFSTRQKVACLRLVSVATPMPAMLDPDRPTAQHRPSKMTCSSSDPRHQTIRPDGLVSFVHCSLLRRPQRQLHSICHRLYGPLHISARNIELSLMDRDRRSCSRRMT